MVQLEMLAPGAALVLWSLIVLLWMVFTRFPAMAKLQIDLSKAKPGGRGQDLEAVLAPEVNWKSHNYTHLMEQPTIFYPAVIILALAGASMVDVYLAWAYVGLRVVHSLWQGLVNRVPVRAMLFIISSVCLLALAVRAVLATLGQAA